MARKSAKKQAFTYFEPARRKATQYEEITLHTQWDPRNFAVAGWFNLDASGNPPWREDATRLVSTDWWSYRDPYAEWFKTFVTRQVDIGRAITQAVEGGKSNNLFDLFDEDWLTFLKTHYSAYRYVEYGLFLALCQAQREAGSDVVAQPIVFQAVEKDRHAQDIVMYLMELEGQIEGFSDDVENNTWMSHPNWQPLRMLVEYLLAARDWGEIYFVVNCIFEPLIGRYFARELVMRNAARNGDSVTPAILQAVDADRSQKLESALELINMIIKQEPSNTAILHEWMDHWLPLAESALESISQLHSDIKTTSADRDTGIARVKKDFEKLAADLGYTASKELAA